MSQEEQKNTQKYEISFLVSKESGAEGIADVLVSHKGEIKDQSPVRNIQLAYPVSKRQEAFFGYVHVMLSPERIKDITEELNHKEEVLRFLVIKSSTGEESKARKISRRDARPTVEKEGEKERRQPPAKQLTNEDLQEKLEEIMS